MADIVIASLLLIGCVNVQGLQLFPAIIIVPMMQISWTMFSILSGGIYFQEYMTMSLARGLGYGLGVAVRPSPR